MQFSRAGSSDRQFLEGRYQNTGPTAPRLDQDPLEYPTSPQLPGTHSGYKYSAYMVTTSIRSSYIMPFCDEIAHQKAFRRG